VIFGGSFDPPTMAHFDIAKTLSEIFDQVLVVPCGGRVKKDFGTVTPLERSEMVIMTFGELKNVKVDLSDVTNQTFTRTYDLDRRLREQINGQVFHVIGTDLIIGGATGESEIQRCWYRGQEVWENLNFVINSRAGFPLNEKDLPSKAEVLSVQELAGSSTEVRARLKAGNPITGLVVPIVEKFIIANDLYGGENDD